MGQSILEECNEEIGRLTKQLGQRDREVKRLTQKLKRSRRRVRGLEEDLHRARRQPQRCPAHGMDCAGAHCSTRQDA